MPLSKVRLAEQASGSPKGFESCSWQKQRARSADRGAGVSARLVWATPGGRRVGKVGAGAGAGEGSAICLSISASPQRPAPAAPSPWRGELPPAPGALCSAAKRAPREPAALGAGRALGGPAPSQDGSGGGVQGLLWSSPCPAPQTVPSVFANCSCLREQTAWGEPFSGVHPFIHSSTEIKKWQATQSWESTSLPPQALTEASLFFPHSYPKPWLLSKENEP